MRKPDLFQVVARPRQQWRNTLDRKYLLRKYAEDRRLITAAGAYFQRLAQFTTGNQDFDHARHDIWLRYRLPETQRQGGVVVGCLLYTSPSPRD